SVPAALARSVPAALARSVTAALGRSVPAALARSVPAALGRSVPAALARSVPAAPARSVPAMLLNRFEGRCMRTRSKSYPDNSNATIPRHQNRKRVPNIVEPEIHTIEEVVPMADRTMEELLQAPTEGNRSSVCAATGTYNQVSPPNRASNQMAPPGFAPMQNNQNRYNQNQGQGNNFNQGNNFQGTLLSNTIPNLKGEMKVVTTRNGLAYEGPSIPTNSSPKKVVEREIEKTTDKEQPNCQGSTAHIQPLVILTPILEPDVLKTQPKHNIPYPSRLNDQKLHKLFELAKVSLNENRSAMLLKKLLEKLGDPDKFLIPCDFPGMDVCHALADLGASINLMPLSIWKKISLPKLTPTRMTLELVDRSITHPKGVTEDVFIKVEMFHFPTDFVVVDFEADPWVPLILGRSFLRIDHALIDVYREEITLRVNDESITFNLNQTMRYSFTYDDNSVNRIDIIDIACEEYVQDVLDFKYNSKSGNSTLVSNPLLSKETKSEFCKEPIVKSSSPTLTPFGESDFLLEEIKDFLKDESIPMEIEDHYYDPEGDILYLEKLLNDDPSQLPPMDLKQAEETKAKSSIESLQN
nr:hypothetical protein [Tanacetum cinerariifolium]